MNITDEANSSTSYELVILMMMALRSQLDELHLELAQAGYEDVRPLHGFIFQLLATRGSATGQEIAEHLGVSKQAASQTIEFLEERSYISRQPLPGDKRGKLVLLTERGWSCIRQVERILAGQQSNWEGVLGRAEVNKLRTSLSRLVKAAYGDIAPNRLRPIW